MLDPLVLSQWDVESLRVSLFIPGGVSISPDLWATTTGTAPEVIDSRPQEGATRVIGSLEQNNLILTIQEERIDWLVRPMVVPPNQHATTPLTVKGAADVFPVLEKAVRHSLESPRVVLRLAFGLVLIKQVPAPDQAIAELSRYLPRLELDSLGGSDFLYQINRRRRSESVRRTQINRLAKWSTAQSGGIQVQVNPGGRPQVTNTNVSFMRRLELDVNTIPETPAMGSDKIPALFGELVALASELATRGDVS